MNKNRQFHFVRIWLLMLVFLAFGTTGYHYLEKMNWVDSMYMTSIILSTVGFGGGLNVLSEAGRLFTVFLIIFGVGIVAYAISVSADFILHNQFFRRRKMEKWISNMNNHYVVCGFGRMGSIICRELNRHRETFIVLENNSQKVDIISELGYQVIQGDSLDDEVLRKCNLESSKGLVAVLSTDENNLFVTLSARGMNKDLFIIAKVSYANNRTKFITAGANKVLNPYEVAGHSLANMLTRPAVVDFLEVISKGSEVDWEMDEIRVCENSSFANKRIEDVFDRTKLDVIIAAIKRTDGRMIFNPNEQTNIYPNDLLIAMGYLENLKKLEVFCT
ncbi:MAG: potassium channel protein [Candidatus Marinimicrobia bacterium]|nr:potassium channel protein [Candidatus Neomarinimicrobiota bacterium]